MYINSPFNYTGNKKKLLPKIMPLFPKNIDTFYDVFTGGNSIGINAIANKVVCNDIQSQMIDFYKNLQGKNADDVLIQLFELVEKYQLTSANKGAFLRLREDYNVDNNYLKLYLLSCYSFCYQIRFNENTLNFNMSVGSGQFGESKQKDIYIYQ